MNVPNRFHTYLIAALAILMVVAGSAALYLTAGTRVVERPAPTVTVTTPGSTVTVAPTAKPRATVRETVRVPGPTRTVKVPGPTVTVTETATTTVTATPPIVESPTPTNTAPMVLNVDTAMDRGWQFRRAAQAWNTALDCQVFAFDVPTVPRAGQALYWVTQVEPGSLVLDGQHVRALHVGHPINVIQFDTKWGIDAFVSAHELGHALGLHHNYVPGSIMNVDDRNRVAPSDSDIALALDIQTKLGRCDTDPR